MLMGEGLSRMMGNCQVRFFGGRDAATYALLPDNFDVRHDTWTAFLVQPGGYVGGGT